MFPQSELDNYKLQVELLQEKLKRSEDHRKQLEEKFEYIMKKRNEHEKVVKTKTRIRYQQFLDEQKERNERNRGLVKMLEQVDQHAAILAARSERLKMMKLQYELYFTKILQHQCMKSIEASPSLSGQYSILPLNHLGNVNTIHNGSATTSNFNNIPTTGFATYRFPANMDYMNRSSTFGDSIVLDDSNVKAFYGDVIGIANSENVGANAISSNITPKSLVESNNSIRSEKQYQNLKEIQGFSQMRNENVPVFNGMGYNFGQLDSHYGQYQKSRQIDKLQTINNDCRREKFLTELTENVNKIDNNGRNEDEIFSAMNTARKGIPDVNNASRRDIKINGPVQEITKIMEPRQKLDNKNILEQSKRHQNQTQQLTFKNPEDLSSEIETVQCQAMTSIELQPKNIDTPIIEKTRAPILWNFTGRIDPNKEPTYPLQLKKKEKLSMEKIENAIYGERINPISRKVNKISFGPPSVKVEKYEQEIPKMITIKAIPSEYDVKNEVLHSNASESQSVVQDHKEKNDSSEKEEAKVIETEEKTPNQIIEEVENKDLINTAKVGGTPPGQNCEVKSSYPEEYEQQNSEESYYIEQNPQEPNNITSNTNEENLYSYYNYQQENITQQPLIADYSESSQPQQYDQSQYQNPDYQTGYQNQDYANYQTGNYQGNEYQQNYDPQAYDQQVYDPNGYTYNYDQNAEYITGSGNYQDNNQNAEYTSGSGNYQDNNENAEYTTGSDNYQDNNQQSLETYPYGTEYIQQGYCAQGNEYSEVEIYETTGTDQSEQNSVRDIQNNPENQITCSLPQMQQQVEPQTLQQSTESSKFSDSELNIKNSEEPLHSKFEESNCEDDEDEILPPIPSVMPPPPSILSTSEKPNDSPNGVKKKKKVNFVDDQNKMHLPLN